MLGSTALKIIKKYTLKKRKAYFFDRQYTSVCVQTQKSLTFYTPDKALQRMQHGDKLSRSASRV